MSDDAVSEALRIWSGYVRARQELLDAKVIRSHKSAEADFAEWLVAQLVGGQLPTSKSHPAFDVQVRL